MSTDQDGEVGKQKKSTSNPKASAAARTTARLAAIQALYQMDMVGSGVNSTIREFNKFRIGKELEEGDQLIKAHRKLFEQIVRGVVDDQKVLDPLIAVHLAEKWKLERIDSILRAILRAGVYELKHSETPARVIMSEYIGIASSFFEAEEPKVVNGVLNAVAREIRSDEFNN